MEGCKKEQDDENGLEEFKKEFLEVQKKYNLPSFEELNQHFYIDKLVDVETDYLVREIRKLVVDKFANYVRFIETFLHPTSAPMFVLSAVRLMNIEDKNKLTEIYSKLSKYEIKVIELDLCFSEKNDAEFINEAFDLWKNVKDDLLAFVKKISANWDNKPEVNGKGYFG